MDLISMQTMSYTTHIRIAAAEKPLRGAGSTKMTATPTTRMQAFRRDDEGASTGVKIERRERYSVGFRVRLNNTSTNASHGSPGMAELLKLGRGLPCPPAMSDFRPNGNFFTSSRRGSSRGQWWCNIPGQDNIVRLRPARGRQVDILHTSLVGH